MGKIQLLDEQLSNMIAAGEVVERPASVIKELVENSIDAGSTKIEVLIEEGGLQTIQVIDNGHGMEREDCLIAFERHATSKIRTARDLFQIRTLGFRGEALPSIASVSRMELFSSLSSGEIGTKVSVEGGQVKKVEDVARVQGTQIDVKDLFYNTPARLKYMKSIATEVGHISDYMSRLAMTHPTISFSLSHNGKNLLQTSGDGKLLHVMAAIYGVQIAKLLIPIEGESLDFRWSGFLSKTDVTRSNRSYISTLINSRYVRSNALTASIMRGYHTLLPIGRYPIAVLDIAMDPSLVDVNVHPSKLEVRFSKEQELCQQIERSVQQTLRDGLRIVKPMEVEKKARVITQQPVQPQFDLTSASTVAPAVSSTQNSSVVSQSSSPVVSQTSSRVISPAMAVREQVSKPYEQESSRGSYQQEPFAPQPVQIEQQTYETAVLQVKPAEPAEPATPESPIPPLYPVGQVHGTYIVAQNDEGMYLVDQHAAQERIFYELFMQKLLEETAVSQMLLFPHTIECTVAEEEKLKRRLPILQSLGLDMEWFGNRSFMVRSHPQWFPDGAELEIIDEIVQYVIGISDKESADIRPIREKAAIMMSCKASIKANRFLTTSEMEALLERLRTTSSPFTCPHGRPIVIHFTTYDLEKMFKRVM
ncbi:DNA mismatch repair endonuclease MutL [Brevibacillus sp. SYSU BS000544]|uniref:DNA mismatch repair endonuclease MutL n=1 Tax=Brevibacillus sp. SYSU BS000544 TaxID=3416443 RepID=UPI003CE48033